MNTVLAHGKAMAEEVARAELAGSWDDISLVQLCVDAREITVQEGQGKRCAVKEHLIEVETYDRKEVYSQDINDFIEMMKESLYVFFVYIYTKSESLCLSRHKELCLDEDHEYLVGDESYPAVYDECDEYELDKYDDYL